MKKSAGVLLYKYHDGEVLVFLAHPGGPFWKNKDVGAWTIPKGEFNDELPLQAAIREFEEEIGTKLHGDFLALEPVKMKSGKTIYAFALQQDVNADVISSNTFKIEWPPRSGKMTEFPEIDKAAWFGVGEAMEKINSSQAGLIQQLVALLNNK